MTEHRTTPHNAGKPPVHTTTIIERRYDRASGGGSGGGSVVVIAIIGLALLLAVGYFLLISDARDSARSDAIIGAAQSVDKAASQIGDAAKDGAEKLKPE